MNITHKLRDAHCEYIKEGGKDPAYMYLGQMEHRELYHYILEQARVPSYESDMQGTHWCGMEVFKVNAITHIGFGR